MRVSTRGYRSWGTYFEDAPESGPPMIHVKTLGFSFPFDASIYITGEEDFAAGTGLQSRIPTIHLTRADEESKIKASLAAIPRTDLTDAGYAKLQNHFRKHYLDDIMAIDKNAGFTSVNFVQQAAKDFVDALKIARKKHPDDHTKIKAYVLETLSQRKDELLEQMQKRADAD